MFSSKCCIQKASFFFLSYHTERSYLYAKFGFSIKALSLRVVNFFTFFHSQEYILALGPQNTIWHWTEAFGLPTVWSVVLRMAVLTFQNSPRDTDHSIA